MFYEPRAFKDTNKISSYTVWYLVTRYSNIQSVPKMIHPISVDCKNIEPTNCGKRNTDHLNDGIIECLSIANRFRFEKCKLLS